MRSHIKALVWEECRVGGLVALFTTLVGVLCLVGLRGALGWSAFRTDAGLILFVVLGLPLLIGFLHLLNMNYAGHLKGGFPERILRLPVKTRDAVAVTLTMRTIFVLISSALLIAWCYILFYEGPWQGTIFVLAGVYLVIQVLDWLRAPISGLTSLLLLALAAVTVHLLGNAGAYAEFLRTNIMLTGWYTPLLFAVCFAAAYCTALAAVQATRVGVRVGIPEIWEWPQHLPFPRVRANTPFSTPLNAQICYELRRSGWVLPGLTLLFWLMSVAVLWLYSETEHKLALACLVLPYPAILLAAVGHGLSQTVVGLSRSRVASFPYTYPLTTTSFTTAKTIANAIVLLGTVAGFLLITNGYYFYANELGVFSLTREALAAGETSAREVVWFFFSRAFLVGLFAWGLFSIGTRITRRILVAAIAVGLLGVVLASFEVDMGFGGETVFLVATNWALLFLLLLTVGAYLYAWGRNMVSLRNLVAWAVVTGLIGFLIYPFHGVRAASDSWPFFSFLMGVASLSLASIAAFPFVAFLFDVHRKRHGEALAQTPTQHAPGSVLQVLNRHRLLTGSGIAAVAFVAWLGWPAEAGYKELWRSKGYPTTYKELDEWYPDYPTNLADEYQNAIEIIEGVGRLYTEQLRKEHNLPPGTPLPHDAMEDCLIAGEADLDRTSPIPRRVWDNTMDYWATVAQPVVPLLKHTATKKDYPSRYPINLTEGSYTELPHLARLRQLGRLLHIDALRNAVLGNGDAAVESVVATIPLANSLDREPLIISQLVRIALLSMAQNSLEDTMNRTALEQPALLEAQTALQDALPEPERRRIIDTAIVGESVLSLSGVDPYSVVGLPTTRGLSDFHSFQPLAAIAGHLALPNTYDRILIAHCVLQALEHGNEPWPVFVETIEEPFEVLFDRAQVIAPIARILMPAQTRAYQAEWRCRMLLATAWTAVAVERFRLDHGRLPQELTELVPEYLNEVPRDAFTADWRPIKYRVKDNGEFVVYSIGLDGEDDQGVEMEDAHRQGDITFTVAPPEIRKGPHIASDSGG